MTDEHVVLQRDGRSMLRAARFHQPQRDRAIRGVLRPHGVDPARQFSHYPRGRAQRRAARVARVTSHVQPNRPSTLAAAAARAHREHMTDDRQPADATDGAARRRARKRLEKKRNLQGGVIVYIVINAFLVGVWAVTGAGYFWPGWVLAGWGVALVLGFWDYSRRPITDAEIDQELRRMQ